MKTRDELLRLIKGLQKKHGGDTELVVKYESGAGKTRRQRGRLLGVRGDAEVGLDCAGKGQKWYALAQILDAWKPGQGET